MDNTELIQLCKALDYSNTDNLTDKVFSSTQAGLDDMFRNYGFAPVLGALSQLWPVEKATAFFDRADTTPVITYDVKTIATHYIRAYNGGSELVQSQLMTLWSKMGYEIILITEEPPHELDYPYPASAIRKQIPSHQDIPQRLITLQKHIDEKHFDIYINHNWSTPLIIWDIMLMNYNGIPFIQYIHGHFAIYFSYGRQYLCTPQIFRQCNMVLSLSETNTRFYQLYGCKSYLIHNPEPEYLSLTTSSDTSDLSSAHILFVGRLSIDKNPMDALKIFHLVNKQLPDTVFDILGSDDNKELAAELKKYCAKNNIEKSVRYHGVIKQTEISKYYRQASLLLFTSPMEGWGMVLLEAKAYGLPIVMYDLPYLTLVNDGMGVLTSPMGNINAMAEHVVKVLSDELYRKSLGSASRQSFESFNKYDLGSHWENIFNICTSTDKNDILGSYYDPDSIPEADKYIEPMLFDMIKYGYDCERQKTLTDATVGRKILFIPRKIFNLLLRIKNMFIHK